MIVFRLIQEKYSPDWEGKGAEIIGRRWNSQGIPMIYTSESRALCTAEIAVHLHLGISPASYLLLTIDIPGEVLVLEVEADSLPVNWRRFPSHQITKNLGDQFIAENHYAVMKVPSAVIPGDFNFLINPHHSDFGKIKVVKSEPYEFDERFFSHR